MGKSAIYNRSHRHRANNHLKNKKAIRPHCKVGGRTGAVQIKRTPSSKTVPVSAVVANPGFKYQGKEYAI